MKKRLFSILLALCMVLCLVPTTAFAESETEEPPVCSCETGLHGRSNERRVSHLRRRGRFAGELCKVRPARRRCGSAAGGGSV